MTVDIAITEGECVNPALRFLRDWIISECELITNASRFLCLPYFEWIPRPFRCCG